MLDLRVCPGCQRHVAITEVACPFCRRALEPAAPPVIERGRRNRIAVFAGATMLAGPGCWTSSAPSQPRPVETQTTSEADEHAQHAFATPPDDRPRDVPPPAIDGGAAPVAIDAGAGQAVGTASLSGVVTSARSKQPLTQFPVQIVAPPAAQQSTFTDGSGRYAFARLPAGDYIVEFGYRNPRTHRAVEARFKLADGETKRFDIPVYVPEPSPVPMPYGAPPARGRVV